MSPRCPAATLLRGRWRNCCVACCVAWNGKPQGEHRALARLARRRDVAAHHARELAGNGEAQARTAEPLRGRGLRLAELLEQFAELLRRHADPGISDGELDEVVLVEVLLAQALLVEVLLAEVLLVEALG